MHFQKLRLSGFKSFLDPVEVQIEDGISGVVGPNGCGKSNVVEALKWVMGETSAKQMRGGEMDDVIFGGTADRPARNIAEVALVLDNSNRDAPAQFNNEAELEVIRRIERGSGSSYKINGRDVRARDVQLLFADLATGAHSTAMVNQGRVGTLIGAKPTQRRGLLEEAAGIKGLHSRRHEAELRLRAAETNLERLDDVIVALEGQFQGLKRQARQAARYRRLGGYIRRHEAIQLHLRWQEATTTLESAREDLTKAEAEVNVRTAHTGEAARLQAEIAAKLPDLRQAEAEAAAELQRLLVAQRELEAEEGRIAQALAAVDQRLNQIRIDIEREKSLGADAEAAIQRMDAEVTEIEAAREGESGRREEARDVMEEIAATLRERESDLAELTQTVAAAEASKDALLNRRDELGRRHANLTERVETLQREREALSAEVGEDTALEETAKAVTEAEAAVESARRTLEEAEATRGAAEQTETERRARLQDAQSARDRLRAEESALADLLKEDDADLFPPLIDAIDVAPGYEKALGAALDDDLTAPIDTAAPVHWHVLPPVDSPAPLPKGTKPLSAFVKGPPALARRLAAIGVIETSEIGGDLHASLREGQRLVSCDGALWRWDGFTVTAGAQTTAATRLSQRNRLAEIRDQLAAVEKNFETARQTHIDSQETAKEAAAQERKARFDLQSVYDALSHARAAHAKRADETAGTRSRIESLAELLERVRADLSETQEQRVAIESSVSQLTDPVEARQRIGKLRKEIETLRTTERERRSVYDRIANEAEQRLARLKVIANERTSWETRVGGARGRIEELQARRGAETGQKEQLAARPKEIETQRTNLMDLIAGSETKRNQASDRLAEMENGLSEADATLRRTEAALGESREARVRTEAQVEQAKSDRDVVAERITERLDSKPETILADAEIDPEEELPPRDVVEVKLERLIRERDNMGPVNLRAEQELHELEEQIGSMQTEREDLLAAIARLRQGISALNREGRERLLAAFEQVNQHFEELFVRLFGGGRAHLALTDAEDPLEAGLEIMASPPGKKLQIMSLLSGGEQALTALALLFAVFLTNPAPICVLDEVDAPLDDANVERFCNLLDEITKASKTRFLVVTHHRLTMAKMDRLFGVTMGERGVSQLVSVDLQTAEQIRDSA
ncbi:MAG: chromosome segregation protein SMC [Pseudomonadota bacterium]|nr:chromosome segregation protein SMC [Pseudomonadota bacterium]